MARSQRRGFLFPAIGLITAVVLSGCGFTVKPDPGVPHNAPSGGQTQADLDATLAEIPGLIFEEAAGSRPNVKGNTGYGFRFTVDPQYQIADSEALVSFLVESAWSVRDSYMPNTSIEITMFGVLEDNLDISVSAVEAGWVPAGSQTHRGTAENGFTSVSVWVDGDSASAEQRGALANLERLGAWPGKVPTLPLDIVVPRSAGQ